MAAKLDRTGSPFRGFVVASHLAAFTAGFYLLLRWNGPRFANRSYDGRRQNYRSSRREPSDNNLTKCTDSIFFIKYCINIDAPCGGVAPNIHVRCSLIGKPKLDAAEELGPRSMHSNEIQISGIAHSNRNAH